MKNSKIVLLFGALCSLSTLLLGLYLQSEWIMFMSILVMLAFIGIIRWLLGRDLRYITATGRDLDRLGLDVGCVRLIGEADQSYRERMIRELDL